MKAYLGAALLASAALLLARHPSVAHAQENIQAGAPAPLRQIGTVRAIEANTLTVTTDKGDQVAVLVSAQTRIVQLPVGSTDLKTAQPAALSDLVVGDRVLAIGSAGETPLTLSARRLVLMKSADIAKQRETEQTGWQHGGGGIVTALDAASGAITLASGARSTKVSTSSSTRFRRYAPSSARFEDARPSTLSELHTGDQMRVRGERAVDGSIKAEEIVSGSFQHLSGTIQSVDAASSQIVVNDLTTKRAMTLSITPGTALHRLPQEVATRFAARAKLSNATPAAGRPATAAASAATTGVEPGRPGAAAGDLSQVVARLPPATLSDFKTGDAVMVVGTDGACGAISALTLLGGVEPILAASPNGGAEVALSPWSVGSGGGGEAAQ